jgi:8-oxo-dGTP diphosphatase
MEVDHGIKRTAVMVILRHGYQYLMLKRSKKPNLGRMVPVGGKVDPYEDPRSTAIREVKEEAGLDLTEEDIRYIGSIIESSNSSYNWICLIYIADIDFINPPVCDEGELKWINKNKIKNYFLPETDPWVYEYIDEKKPFMFNAIFDESLKLVSMIEEIENIKII